MDLGESVLRAERNRNNLTRQRSQNSQNSIIEGEVESPSKDSISSVGWFPPPTYESIYGKEIGDMPPSYSDILFQRCVRTYNLKSKNIINSCLTNFFVDISCLLMLIFFVHSATQNV